MRTRSQQRTRHTHRYPLRSARRYPSLSLVPRTRAPPRDAEALDLQSGILPPHRQVPPAIGLALRADAIATIRNDHCNRDCPPPYKLGVHACGSAIHPGDYNSGIRRKAAGRTVSSPGKCPGPPPVGAWRCGACSSLLADADSDSADGAAAAAPGAGPCAGCEHCQGVVWACADCGKEVCYRAFYGSGSGKGSNGFDPAKRRIVPFSEAETNAARAIEQCNGLEPGTLNTVSQITYQGSACVPSCARRSRARVP